jgi:hypothetical protein
MRRGLSLLGLMLVVSVVGWGYTIDLLSSGALWNTGWTSGGVYGTNDAADGHYTWERWQNATRTTVISSGTAYIINDTQFPFPNWRPNISNPATAAWVSYAAGPPNLNQEAWFSYYTSFTLPATYSYWNVAISVDVWADNQPQFIGLYSGSTLLSSATPASADLDNNISTPPTGHVLGYHSSPSGTGLPLNATWLAPGTYTIRFDVYNASGTGNPTGLFVLFRSAEATGVPEPATYALMGTVGLALYLLRRRRAGAKS